MELGVFPSQLQWPYMETFPLLWKPQERMSPKTKTKNITSVYFKLLVTHQNRFGFIPQGSQDDVQGLIREPFSNRRCIWDFISRQCWFHIRHLQEQNNLQYIMYIFVYCLGAYQFDLHCQQCRHICPEFRSASPLKLWSERKWISAYQSCLIYYYHSIRSGRGSYQST